LPPVQNRIFSKHLNSSVICILHGVSLGIAIDISSACDIRLCSKDTKFSIKEVDIGIAADVGTLQRFPRVVGNDSWTRELAFTGRYFSASEALERGFVSYVCDTLDKAVEKGLDIASVIAGKSPVAVQGTKTLLDYSRDHTIREGILMTFTVDDRVGVYAVMELYLFADGRISVIG
jgi:delta(3,5)-delta(2,4)-dienoyl-CoA isomerase